MNPGYHFVLWVSKNEQLQLVCWKEHVHIYMYVYTQLLSASRDYLSLTVPGERLCCTLLMRVKSLKQQLSMVYTFLYFGTARLHLKILPCKTRTCSKALMTLLRLDKCKVLGRVIERDLEELLEWVLIRVLQKDLKTSRCKSRGVIVSVTVRQSQRKRLFLFRTMCHTSSLILIITLFSQLWDAPELLF